MELQCYYNLSAAVFVFAGKRFETNEGRMREYGNEEESLLSFLCQCSFHFALSRSLLWSQFLAKFLPHRI